MQPEALTEAVNAKQEVNWPRLLEEALTLEGSMSGIYERFVPYSFGNQMLLHMQGVEEPVNTFKRWADMGRQVLRGSKAKAIMVPLIYKTKNEAGQDEERLRGFKLKNCLFTVSDTEGDELPPAEPIDWSKPRAIGALALTEVPFTLLDGNIQGFSFDRNISVSPVAAYPMKTWLHEAAHIVSGHTTEAGLAEYRQHQGIYELEAEGSAYILVNELEITEQSDLAESRAYIRGWLGRDEAPDTSVRRIFKTSDTIIKAGRVAVPEVVEVAAG